MNAFLQDLRYALRGLRRSPGFAATAIGVLGLGIGAATTIFSLVDTLYLKGLPVPEPSGLVEVYQSRNGSEYFNLSFVDYLHYREHTTSFADLAAHYSHAPINLMTPEASREINGSVATASYFHVLGLTPRLGRFFLPEEDRIPGRDPVAVISDGLWKREFGADPNILGRTIRLNATSFTVVGVAPPEFHGVPLGGLSTDVWIPSAMFHVGYRYCDAFQRGCNVVTMIGRLAPGRSLSDARRELGEEARQLAAAFPETNRGRGLLVIAARGVDPEYRRAMGSLAPLLLGFSALVLAAACANLAALLLARASARHREIAIRRAIGASRPRIIRQLLTESLVLSVAGGILGVLVAFWAKDLVAAFYAADSEGRTAYFGLSLDPAVLVLAAATAVLTGVVFGLAPALHASRADLGSGWKDATSSRVGRGSRLRSGLVISQVAISLVLAAGAGLLLRSLGGIYRGPGFDPKPIVLLRLRPSLVAYDAENAQEFQRAVIHRLETVPGVAASSPADRVPLPGWGDHVAIWSPGREPDLPEHALQVLSSRVGPRYFETLGLRLLAGREFRAEDRPGAPRVAIVNATLTRTLWGGGDAVGRTIVVDGVAHTVIGVAPDAQYRDATQSPIPFLYASYWQTPSIDRSPIDARLHVRVTGEPRAMLARIRTEIAAVDPDVPISEDRPLTDWLDYSFQPVRIAGTILVAFGGLGLAVSALGLYGLLAFSVARRTRDIAIRMALGADARRLARSVLRHGIALAAAGSAIGVAAVVASARCVATLLFGVPAIDPIALLGAAALLFAVAALASYLPARRVTRIDPVAALRTE